MTQYAKIEAATIPERYARGWHTVGPISNFTKTPVRLDIFGTKLVAYQGDDGDYYVLDAYCPHMGADLSDGTVEGSGLRCPFHHWRWEGSDGKCDDIPYAKRIPGKACIKSWPTLVENNLLFIWNDPEDNAPIPEQKPPRMEECFNGEWTDWVIDENIIHTNCRELVDNMADCAHFGPVHCAGAVSFENVFDRHMCQQIMSGTSPRLAGDEILKTVATYYGPAYMITEMQGELHGMEIHSRLMVSHTPVDTESFTLRFGVMVKKLPGMDDEQNKAMAEQYVQLSQQAFLEDVVIWHSKVRVDNPILCDGDGPVTRLRSWYDQFYVDIADVPGQWSERKTHALKVFNPIPEHRLEDVSTQEETQEEEPA